MKSFDIQNKVLEFKILVCTEFLNPEPWAYPEGGGTGGRLFKSREFFEILIITECFLKLKTVSKLGEYAVYQY